MAVIDIGPGATNRPSYLSVIDITAIDLNNPANDTGTLDTFEIFANVNCTEVKIGTFNGSGTDYTVRDYESIGSVTSGSKQTFTGKNCDVKLGDYLGIYKNEGRIERTTSSNDGVYYLAGDQFGAGTQTYALLDGDAISIYATGTTGGGATVKPHYYYLQQ